MVYLAEIKNGVEKSSYTADSTPDSRIGRNGLIVELTKEQYERGWDKLTEQEQRDAIADAQTAATAPGTSGESFLHLAQGLATNYGIVVTTPAELIGKGDQIKDTVRGKLNDKKKAALDAVDTNQGLRTIIEKQQDVIEELANSNAMLLEAVTLIMRQAAGK